MKKTGNLIPLYTKWGEGIDKDCPLNDYPRPQLKRDQWQNLNGRWEYAIVKNTSNALPEKWDGDILVPFSPESLLSGVERQLLPNETLWYNRVFKFDLPKENQRLLLHFGAVDQFCTVYCGGKVVGEHAGGYWPFHFDITDLVTEGENTVTVAVRDDSDTKDEAYGKQKLQRGGIWYTTQSGIWQTVWCEIVSKDYIENIKITPMYDDGKVKIELLPSTIDSILRGEIEIFDEDILVAKGEFENNTLELSLPKFKSWSPDNPFLYTAKITSGEDIINSYFGMRKFSMGKDGRNNPCMMLNNTPIFQNGLLDQGYWSDGMYTPPSDDAMVWEIEKVKSLGFNMLRKHIKIEPLRWYYHCDRLGMLVWQDFVSGGHPYSDLVTRYAPWIGLTFKDDNYPRFGRESKNGRKNFLRDGQRSISLLYNTVSLCVWVPFNEGWGQFDAKAVANYVEKKDPTRPIDHASGYHDQKAGDFYSFHIYYKKFIPKKDKMGRALALTEFGGYSLPSKGHMSSEDLFGYKIFKSQGEFDLALQKLYETEIISAIDKGLNVTIYTQVSDVEDEINGLFTYDRKVVKVNVEQIRKTNQQINSVFNKNL